MNKLLLAAVLMTCPLVEFAPAQCTGCDDTSDAETPIASVTLKGAGLISPIHYATVHFTFNSHDTWDGACWQPLIDQGIVMCFEEYPCTYQRELVATYANGPHALPGNLPKVSWSGTDCDGPIEGTQWLIGGEGFAHTLWADVLGVSCGSRCTMHFSLVCGYGSNNGPNGPLQIPLLPIHWTNWAHMYTCRECQ